MSAATSAVTISPIFATPREPTPIATRPRGSLTARSASFTAAGTSASAGGVGIVRSTRAAAGSGTSASKLSMAPKSRSRSITGALQDG